MSKIGILDLQGGVAEHAAHIRDCGQEPVFVKKPEHLENVTGLILPGGESSTLRKLLALTGLDKEIQNKVKKGMKVWGTCAGAILCASKIVGEEPCLAIIDIEIERNIFGSQLSSFTEYKAIPIISDNSIKLVFIRAPGIKKVWGTTNILLETKGVIVAAENSSVLATSFHPELSPNREIHKYFIKKSGLQVTETNSIQWDRNRWMKK
ncbi:MAG TPA: pyridoxal 5'-phosphate synthase glutaminase subunit PdxT [bacterium]|nr:pyridoxal 5'-phosphate synthase glutaminase subunit PdxT [bacterium]